MQTLDIYPITWNIIPGSKLSHDKIIMCGLGIDGIKRSVVFDKFSPHFYIQLPPGANLQTAGQQIKRSIHKCIIGEKQKFTSYVNWMAVTQMHPVHFYSEHPLSLVKVYVTNYWLVGEISSKIAHLVSEGLFPKVKCLETDSRKHPLLSKFFIATGYKSAGWQRFEVTPNFGTKLTKLEEEFIASSKQVTDPSSEAVVYRYSPPEEPSAMDKLPPMTIMSYDIESYTPRPESFPDPALIDCSCYLIAVRIDRGGKTIAKKVLLLGDLLEEYESDAHDLVTFNVRDEIGLNNFFFNMIRKYDITAITGYNTPSYDLPVLITRREVFGVLDIPDISCVLGYNITDKNRRTLHKNARDDVVLDCPGVIFPDVYNFILANNFIFKYRNLTLDEVAHDRLGTGKEDVPYLEQFYAFKHYQQSCKMVDKLELETVRELYQQHRDKVIEMNDNWLDCIEDIVLYLVTEAQCDERTGYIVASMILIHRVIVYCMTDASLPLDLLNNCNVIATQAELAAVYGCPIDHTWSGSKQAKLYHAINNTATKHKIVMTERTISRYVYDGGYVHEPVVGLHRFVGVLDIMSMYPSIIIAQGVSPDNLLYPGSRTGMPTKTYPMRHGDIFTLVQDPKRKGVLVYLEEEALASRAKSKKIMNSCGPDEEDKRALYNAKQAAEKVVCNSVYGVLGMDSNANKEGAEVDDNYESYAMFQAPECANIITSEGQKCNVEMTRLAKEYDGVEVVYGDTDSIMVQATHLQSGHYDFYYKMNEEINVKIHPMKLEFEMFCDIICIKKKTYVKMLRNKDGSIMRDRNGNPKFEFKGVPQARNDRAKIVSHIHTKLVMLIFEGAHCVKVLRTLMEECIKILAGEYDNSYFTITQRFSGMHKSGSIPKIAKKFKSRGKDIQTGDKISYLVTSSRGKSVSEKAESVENVVKEGLEIDYMYYIEKLSKSIDPLIQIAGEYPDEIKSMTAAGRRKNDANIVQNPILFFKDSVVYSRDVTSWMSKLQEY